jgi:hypothetical protein
MKGILYLVAALLPVFTKPVRDESKVVQSEPLVVSKCSDFEISGKGDHAEWKKAAWHSLTRLDSAGHDYATRFRIMYSATGIYVLFTGEDSIITTRYDQDMQDLYNGDVFEVFFHTDTTIPIYLEYEINALNKELVLLVPNFKGRSYGWLPFHYANGRRVKKMVDLSGGKMEAGASVHSWSAELFFPYAVFNPLGNIPPKSGTIWNANFYRLDYDSGAMVKWAWSPVVHSFHEIDKFRPIRFE